MRYAPLNSEWEKKLPMPNAHEHLIYLRKAIAVLKKVRYALCPRRPMPTEAYAHEYLI